MDPPTLPPSSGSQDARADVARVPGLVVVFSRGSPAAHTIALADGALADGALADGALEIGRGDASAGKLDDGRVSRQHARIELCAGRWAVTDLGSQNGTFVDGRRAIARVATPLQRVIRVGDSVLIPCSDVRPIARAGVVTIDGMVGGPVMQDALAQAATGASSGAVLHIRGESGTGKERIAQAFHRASAGDGALVVANCAAIPRAIAERLLFGAKRGAYSGADADAIGYLQEADGGTLFLDEVAELDLQVQAKLLRVLETKELLPLGASKPRRIHFALCSATHKDLRALVAAGVFREDLYFRIGHPTVTLPALRNRPEEVPALIAAALTGLSPPATVHASFVEQCLLRPWPGNVRELLAATRSAAHSAQRDGSRVAARHLAANAGMMLGSSPAGPHPEAPADREAMPAPARRPAPPDDPAWHRRIADAMHAHAGNVSAAARALGLHRNQLRRLIARGIVSAPTAAGRDDAGD